MSNAIVVPASFNGQVAAVFQGQQAGDDLSGGITGGYGLIKIRGKVWSIQHNGNTMNLMREDGDGPRGSIDIVIVKANAQLSKTYYINGWDENNANPPDCASANGIVPDAGVPHQQSPVCATCPRNAWGSAPGGGKGKACGDHRRLAVVPLTDLRNESFGGPLLLRCPAASLQDMAAFDSRYKGMGYPYFTMGIKVGFDPAESYPKLTFAAIRPLTDAEGAVVMELRNSPETARVISEGTAPAPAQVAATTQGAFLEQLPPGTPTAAAAQAPQQVAVQPAPVAAQPVVAQPAPVAAQPQPAPVAAPAVVAAAPATAGGFGPVSAAPVANPAAQPAPAAQAAVAPAQPQTTRAAMTMTGFGGVTPEVTAQPSPAPAVAAPVAAPAVEAAPLQPVAQPAPTPAPAVAAPVIEQPAPVTPGVVSAFEGSIDDRLNALLQ
jgi:hypothetical protein